MCANPLNSERGPLERTLDRLRRVGDDALFSMAEQHQHAVANGLLDSDEPTPYSHYLWEQEYLETVTAEFTPDERATIRMRLGL